jgi:ribose-phosphate pyrophosphokinase
MNGLLIFGGNSNPGLFSKICKELGINCGSALVSKFPDGEIKIEIQENVRGKDVFIIQSVSPPVNDNLVELLLMIDAIRRASAKRITAVIPYFGYARQDRKHKGRVPISARVVADIIESSGVDRVLTIDLHAPQIQGFFTKPLDHFPGHIAFKDCFKEYLPNLVVVSPDAGSVQRALPFVNKLNVPLAIIDKRRIDENKTEVRTIVGEVKGKTVLLPDDIVSTGGTLVKDAEALISFGAKRVVACITHGVFSPNSAEKLNNSCIEKIYITDTVLSPYPLPLRTVQNNSFAPFLAEGIRRIHENRSVSEILEHT